MAPSKSTAEEVSLDWSQHRISLSRSTVRTTFRLSVVDNRQSLIHKKEGVLIAKKLATNNGGYIPSQTNTEAIHKVMPLTNCGKI